jgi:hypothetical protein
MQVGLRVDSVDPGWPADYHRRVRQSLTLALLLVVTGCGRLGYGRAPSEGDGGPRDGDVDGAFEPPLDAAPDADVSLDASEPRDAGALDAFGPDALLCSESPCRLVLEQCGCPGGQMCTRPFPMSSERACRPIGPLALGEACTWSTECTIGTGCIRANDAGICALWCGSSADCPDGSTCARFVRTDPEVGACSWPCNPVTNAGCPVTHQCVMGAAEELGTGDLFGTTFCAGQGTLAVGDPCTALFECRPGTECDGVCRQTCAIGAGDCPTGTACGPMSPDVSVGGVSYGVCRP